MLGLTQEDNMLQVTMIMRGLHTDEDDRRQPMTVAGEVNFDNYDDVASALYSQEWIRLKDTDGLWVRLRCSEVSMFGETETVS